MIRVDCPSREDLHAYLVGNVSEQATEALAEHIEACPECLSTLAALDEGQDGLIARLRRREDVEDEFVGEPQCQAALARAEAMIRESLTAGVPTGSTAPSAIPKRLGEYEVLEELGAGGMGTVYRARHIELERVVAIKVISRGRTEDRAAIVRFRREIKAVGQLNHPNIVQAYDAREIEGVHFLVMEFVEGSSLAEVVRHCGPLRIPDACELVRQAAIGLQYAHRHGLVHRDIKPSNLMLARCEGAQPVLKILDLGLALLQVEQSGEEATRTGQAIGTADYIAPEQVTNSHDVDIRADIYSLGCTLYKLLIGHAPFSGPDVKSDFDKMMAHVQRMPTPIRTLRPDVPEQLAAILECMMAKSPADRFATPGEVAERMAAFTTGCDLADLLAQATGPPRPSAPQKKPIVSTVEYLPSSVTETHPGDIISRRAGAGIGEQEPRKTLPSTKARRRRLTQVAAGSLLAGMLAATVFGIVIWINRTRLEVPDGSRVAVEADDTVRVTTPGATGAGRLPSSVLGEGPGVRAYKPGPPLPKAKVFPTEIDPQPLPWKPGGALSKMALVTNPPSIPGVRSWTIETTAHRDRAASIAYSPDGRTLATGSFDGTIRLWDSATRKLTRILLGHNDNVFSIAWSPDGKYLAAGGFCDHLYVWDAKSGLLVHTYPQSCEALAWSPNGRTIAIGLGRNVTLLDLESEATPRVLDSETAVDEIQTIAWSPDGGRLATHTMRGMIGIWDVKSGALRHALKGPQIHTGMNHTLAWSPDGKVVAATGVDRRGVMLWEAESGQPCGECETEGGGRCLGWSPDGTKIAMGDNVRRYLWDLETGTGTPRWCSSWPGEGDFAVAAAWSPDGTKLAFGSVRGSVLIYPTGSSPAPDAVLGHAAFSQMRGGGDGCPTFSPKGSTLAFVDSEWALRVWDIASSWPPKPLHDRCPGAMYHLTWSQNGKTLAGWSQEKRDAPVWSIESGSFQSCARSPNYGHLCRAIALSADAAILALTWEDKTELWDANSGVMLRKLGGGGHSLAWSHDGKILAVGGDKGLELRDPASGAILKTLAGANSPVLAIAWSPDGRWLAGGIGNSDPAAKSVFVWDARSGELHRTFSNVIQGSCSLRWLSGGRTLIVASWRTVQAWDLGSGKRIRSIETFADDASADGRFAVGGFGSAIRLCSLSDGRALYTLVGLRGGRLVLISPNGHFRGTPEVEKDLVYVALLDSGEQVTLTPEEFSKRYGWKNDPEKVRLVEVKTEGGVAKPQQGTGKADGAKSAEPAPMPSEKEKPKANGGTPPASDGDQSKTPLRAYKPGPPLPKPKVVPIQIDPEPLPWKPGDPLSKMALVTNPAPIPGGRSWTIDTTAHRGPVKVAPSPDGRLFATASHDGTIRIWDSESVKLVRTFLGCGSAVHSLAWWPDGAFLVSGAPFDERPIRLWDAKSGLLLRSYPREAVGGGEVLALSPDGKTLVIAESSQLRLWRVQLGKLRPTQEFIPLGSDFGGIFALAWSPDGNSFAVGGGGKILRIYDAQSLVSRQVIRTPAYIMDLAWSPDGRVVGCAGDSFVTLWDAESGQACVGPPKSQGANYLAWTPDGSAVLIGTNPPSLWDSEERRFVAGFGGGKGHLVDRDRNFSSVAFLPGGKRCLWGTSAGSVRIDDMVSERQLHSSLGHGESSLYECCSHYFCPAFSPTGKTIAFPDPVSGVWVWQIGVSSMPRLMASIHKNHFPRVAWSLNGGVLAATRCWTNVPEPQAQDLGTQLWNMESGKWLGISFGPSSGPTDAALSPDGKTFATTGPEETEIREATSGRVLRKLGLGAERLAWSPDGKYLAAAAKKQVTLCDPKTGGIVKRLSSPADPFVAMAPSPDGRSLAALTVASSLIVGNSPDGPGKVFIWDVHSGELRRSFDPQTRFPKSLRWVSDGRTLVVSSQGGLTTFDADSGKLVRKLGSGELPIYSYADDVSADGRLAVQGGPSFIRLRSLPDGRTLLTLLCLRGGRFVLISPDGHYRGDPGVEKELVYVVQTDQGQETLTPEEFAKRYGWKNDPGKARPLPEPDALKPSPQRKPGAEQPKPAR